MLKTLPRNLLRSVAVLALTSGAIALGAAVEPASAVRRRG